MEPITMMALATLLSAGTEVGLGVWGGKKQGEIEDEDLALSRSENAKNRRYQKGRDTQAQSNWMKEFQATLDKYAKDYEMAKTNQGMAKKTLKDNLKTSAQARLIGGRNAYTNTRESNIALANMMNQSKLRRGLSSMKVAVGPKKPLYGAAPAAPVA